MVNKLNGVVGDFTGYPLIAVPFMADTVQARKHKKKRINKKWLKRYGIMQVPWKKLLLVDGTIYGHPLMIEKLIAADPAIEKRVQKAFRFEVDK